MRHECLRLLTCSAFRTESAVRLESDLVNWLAPILTFNQPFSLLSEINALFPNTRSRAGKRPEKLAHFPLSLRQYGEHP